MSGKRLILVFFGLLVATLGFIFWIGATGGGTANHPSQPPPSGSPSTSTGASTGAKEKAGGKKARDELRERILAAWAAEPSYGDETRNAARAGRFVAPPAVDGGGIDPAYVERIMREEMKPMARQCYENFLAKSPDAGGRLLLELTVVADDPLGGIVEDARIDETSTLKDDALETCIRESAMTLAFPPPAHDGVVTLKVPMTFARVEHDE